jgi:hypothetical protein
MDTAKTTLRVPGQSKGALDEAFNRRSSDYRRPDVAACAECIGNHRAEPPVPGNGNDGHSLIELVVAIGMPGVEQWTSPGFVSTARL